MDNNDTGYTRSDYSYGGSYSSGSGGSDKQLSKEMRKLVTRFTDTPVDIIKCNCQEFV